jgi:hypothetical protein
MVVAVLAATECAQTRTSGLPTAVSGDATATAPAQAGRVVVSSAGTTLGDDDYILNSATIFGDTLRISVSYGGGCEVHAFALVIAASFIESSPVRLPVLLRHEANGDACVAWLTQSYVFDLALIRTRYREAYGPGQGSVVLELDGVPGSGLVYEFTA